jgi:dipeptidyl aminopeptidase/acylaminoacyl peptidase
VIGSWWTDRERLRDTSPVFHAKEIRTPLLLMHGAMDRAVPVSHGRDMAEALKAATSRPIDTWNFPSPIRR